MGVPAWKDLRKNRTTAAADIVNDKMLNKKKGNNTMTEFNMELLASELQSKTSAMALLDLNRVTLEDGKMTITVTIQDKHLNAHGGAHGGILYTICDQAVAAYDIAIGRDGVGMDGSMHYYRPARKGDVLKAIVTNRKMGRKTGNHFVELVNQDGRLIADAVFTSMYLDEA